jgi:hypothetical protein
VATMLIREFALVCASPEGEAKETSIVPGHARRPPRAPRRGAMRAVRRP